MAIDKIIDSFMAVLEAVRLPAKEIPSILLICSMMRRPGLSLLASVAKVAVDLNKLGFNLEPMPDGTMNYTTAFTTTILKEAQRMIREDLKIEAAIMPGSLAVGGLGAATNVTPGKIYGVAH